jgi:hypothetical protein
MEIGGAKAEVAHNTELKSHSQAVACALIGVNEGPIYSVRVKEVMRSH